MTKKAQYLQQICDLMTMLGQLAERAQTLKDVHADREYASLLTNPISQADLTEFGVTVADLDAAIQVITDLNKLGRGVTVTANAGARATINKWRNL